MKSHKHRNAWVVSVNMGYGHERAAYGLKDLANDGIITANDYPSIPKRDQMLWSESRKIYEALSRLKPLPIIGDYLFEIIDKTQRIAPFYPRRDLSAPTAQVKQTYFMIEQLGLGKHLVEKLSKIRFRLSARFSFLRLRQKFTITREIFILFYAMRTSVARGLRKILKKPHQILRSERPRG